MSLARLSILSFLSVALTSLAAPSLNSRQAGGSEGTGWLNLPDIEGASIIRDWPMKGSTLVRSQWLLLTFTITNH